MPLAGQVGATGLPALLVDLNERALSGTLVLEAGGVPTVGDPGTRLHFIRGRLIAVETASLGGEAALGALATSSTLNYRFTEGFVQLSSFAPSQRINKALEALLPLLGNTAAMPDGTPPAAPREPTHAANTATQEDMGTASFIPDQFAAETSNSPVVSADFTNTLRVLVVRQIGPAGQFILEGVCQELRMDLGALRRDQVAPLIAALTRELPTAQRAPFQAAVDRMLRQFNA